MIPKYILKEVLFYKEKYKDQIEITRLVPNKNYIEYTSEVTGNPYNYITHDKINIYELAHLCKEWAVNLSPNKHALSSYPRWGDIRNYKKTNGSYYICQHLVSGAQFEAETEPEAIFKACQWILTEDSK